MNPQLCIAKAPFPPIIERAYEALDAQQFAYFLGLIEIAGPEFSVLVLKPAEIMNQSGDEGAAFLEHLTHFERVGLASFEGDPNEVRLTFIHPLMSDLVEVRSDWYRVLFAPTDRPSRKGGRS